MPTRRTLFLTLATAALALGGLAVAADPQEVRPPRFPPLRLVVSVGQGELGTAVVTLSDARRPVTVLRAGFAAARLDGGRGYEIDTALERLETRMNRETRTSVTLSLDQAAYDRVLLVLDRPRAGGQRYGSWADVRRLLEDAIRAAGRDPPRRTAHPAAFLAALDRP